MRVFDVCGTLYSSNTTFDFIVAYHKSRHNIFKNIWISFLLSFPFKVLNKMKILSIRRNVIFTLRGERKEDLVNFSMGFVDGFLAAKEKTASMQLLRAEPLNSLLISASIDPVIDALAHKLNVKAYSSLLEYNENDLCTGKLSVDLKGCKSKKVNVARLEMVATDNMSDIDLIRHSKFSYIVLNKNNKNAWLLLLSQNCIDLDKVIFL